MSIKSAVDKMLNAIGVAPPVDRTQRTLTDGSPVTDDHRELRPDGQQKGYVVLSAEERARGFVRPVRKSYVHVGRLVCGKIDNPGGRLGGHALVCTKHPSHDGDCGDWKRVHQTEMSEVRSGLGGCGTKTTMGQTLAETYARDPYFYSGTFCCGCGKHFPVGPDGEFVWDGTNQRVGT